MARKVDKTPKLCVICGDKAKGINFNALTCMSCKAFFRRNALRNKEMKCPFNDSCQVDKITRKFCSKCRLKKCFDCGMKKEWILSEEEKKLIKEKILRNRLRRQQQELESQQSVAARSNHSNCGNKQRSIKMATVTTAAVVGSKSGKRRTSAAAAAAAAVATKSVPSATVSLGKSGGGGTYRNRATLVNYENNNNNSMHYSSSSGGAIPYTSPTLTTTISGNNGTSNCAHTSSSGTSSSKHVGSNSTSSINAYNIFHEPSAYSLDVLLTSDNSVDALFDPYGSGSSGSIVNTHSSVPSNTGLEEWLTNTNHNSVASVELSHSKSDDFLSYPSAVVGSTANEMDESLNEYNLLFSNANLDLFENDPEIEGIISGSSSGISECNESNSSPNNNTVNRNVFDDGINSTTTATLIEMKNATSSQTVTSSSSSNITAATAINNSTFEYVQVKPEDDFTQYLLHDNDPTILGQMAASAQAAKLYNIHSLNPANGNQNQLSYHAHTSKALFSNWDSVAVANQTRYQNEAFNNRSKIPPLIKMTNNQIEDTTDFISNCLISSNDQTDEICNYDPVIEFVPRIGDNSSSLTRDIGFSSRELILPERCLIKELTDACSVLQSPYKRIIVYNNYDSIRSCRITEYSFHRMIRMSKRLSRFSQLAMSDQVKLLKSALLEMLAIRSVLAYNPDRESWGFVDDKCKVNVMVRMDVIRPFCTKNGFQRHRQFPKLFRHEWKTDNIIFDLLTTIVLFTPRPGLCQYEKIKEEHLRYTYLLRRYLEIKYPTITEAKETFGQLMSCVEEMRQLNADIIHFFRNYSQLLQTSPLFTQMLDLHATTKSAGPEQQPSHQQVQISNHSRMSEVNYSPPVPPSDSSHVYNSGHVEDHGQISFTDLDQLDNLVKSASTSSTLAPSLTHGSYDNEQPTSGTFHNEPMNGPGTNNAATTVTGFNSVNVSNSPNSSTVSTNGYRECIINSVN